MKHHTESKHTGPIAPPQRTTRQAEVKIRCQGGCNRYYTQAQIWKCPICGIWTCFVCRNRHMHNED